MKAQHCLPTGELQLLPIPEGHWETISIDFIVKLPESGGYDAIMVVIDSAGKQSHFIRMNAYHLTLLLPMKHLYLVFNVVKLTLAPPDPIPSRHAPPPPPPELIDGEEEYVVEKILDSRIL
jgi:hypothetical protein